MRLSVGGRESQRKCPKHERRQREGQLLKSEVCVREGGQTKTRRDESLSCKGRDLEDRSCRERTEHQEQRTRAELLEDLVHRALCLGRVNRCRTVVTQIFEKAVLFDLVQN